VTTPEPAPKEPEPQPAERITHRVDINANGRQVTVETSEGSFAEVVAIVLATWKATDGPVRRTVEASGFGSHERADGPTYEHDFPGTLGTSR
jgi:hypothetical protein